MWQVILLNSGRTWLDVAIWAVGAVILVAGWLLIEGARDIAEEIADPSRDTSKWSTVRPRVILAYFLIVAIAVGVVLLARWMLHSAT